MNESFEPITMEELFGKASNVAPQTFKPITMEELFPDVPKQQLNPLKDITGLGTKQAEDFNHQLATRKFSPVQAYQQFENYGKKMSDYYTEKGYSPQQIEKIKKEFVASADPRNKTNWWDYYVSDRANDVMVGTGNLLVDALAAVPENIPVLGKLADDAEKYTRDVTQAWQNAVSDKQKIQTYLGERAEKEALANGAGELGGLWANLKENPMQMASLFSQQAPQLALGALGKIPAAITYMMGGAGRVRNDIEQAYEDTYKNNPAQLLQLPEIQSRMKQGMSFEQAVNDAKTDITDNWKSIVAGAAIAGTEALAPFSKVGQGVNRGVVGTFAKEIGQEAFQEGAEQLNSNLAVGQIDGKTQAFDNVVRNAALGGIAGGLTGIPSAVDAYLNRDSGAENLVDQLNQSAQQGIQANEQAAERATQGQNVEIDGVNQQVLEQVVSGISDQDLRDSYYDELKKDIQDGVIEERANSNSTYGKLAREYLQQTQAQAQPEVQLQATHQTDNASHINPEIERVLDLRKRMMDWRAGKKVNNINDLLDTPMSFANQEAKRDFAIERAFGEVQAIAEKYNIDHNDGKAIHQWLEDYIAKRDQAQSEAQAYSQAVNPEENIAIELTEAEAALQQTANIAPTQNRNVIVGGQDSVDIGENNYQPFQYEVIEAAELSPTQQKAGNQLRDRDRVASQSQVNKIARNLDPRKLADSPTMEMGAPLLAQDGKTIIAGNGRSMAIRQAYQEGLGENYRQYLYQNATKFGLDQNQLATMQNPVLVRRLNTAVDIKQTAINSNEQGGMRMSNLEQAKVDAGRLPNMANFELGENGELNTTGNQGFIRQFIQNQPENLRNELLDSKGNLSQTGVQRLRNAMLYTAYGDTETLARAVESTDVGARNIITALTRIAPKVAQIKQDISNGSLSDVDISNDIVSAVEKYNQLKSQNRDVNEYLQQQDFVGELSPESKSVLQIFNENARSAKRISDVLTSYYNTAEVQGNTAQSSMFDDLVFDKAGTLEQAKRTEIETEQNEIRYSRPKTNLSNEQIIDNASRKLKQFGQSARENKYLPSQPIDLGNTPQALVDLGVPQLPMVIDPKKIPQIVKNEDKNRDHNIAPDLLAQVPTALQNPLAIYDSATEKGTFVLVTELKDSESRPVIAAVHINKKQGYHLVNKVASIYGRNDAENTFKRWKNNGLLRWEKSQPELTSAELQSPMEKSKIGSSEVTLNNSVQDVNNQVSPDPQTLQDQQALSRLLGEEIARHIEVVDRNTVQPPKDETIESLQSVEGWYIQKTQKAYIYADSVTALFGLTREERLAWVAWHELAHKGLDVKYRNVLNAVLKQVKKHPVVAVISRRIQESNPKYTENVAIEEALVELYSAYQTGNWDSLNQRYNTRVHPSYYLNGKSDMGNVFKRFATVIKRLIANLSKNKRAEMMAEKDLFNLLKRIDGSVMELANRNPTANTQEQSNVRYSLNENADSDFAKAVDDFIEGNQVATSISMGTTPDVLKMIGLPDVEVKIQRKTLGKIMRGKHAIEPETLKQLPSQLNDPVGVFKSAPHSSNPDGYVVLTELTEFNSENNRDEPIIAALHLDKSGEVQLIEIASAYGKNHQGLQNILNKDKAYYWNKEKGSQLANVHWLQLPLKLRSEANLSENNIKTETDLSQYQDENLGNPTANTQEQSDVRYSFAGMNAQNADNVALARAMDMAEEGTHPEEIRKQTGWFQGADGKWRFEVMEDPKLITPHQAYEDFQWQTEYNQNELKTRLGEVWKDKRLFEAYPHLANLNVTIKPLSGYAQGYFDPTTREIVLSSHLGESAMRSALVHEVQHVIQARERFLNGSGLDIEKARFKGNQTGNVSVDKEIAKLEQALSQTQDPNQIAEIQASIESYKELVAENNYQRIAGEVEARNAQTRLNMTEEERQARSPESTEDIPRHNQILRDYQGERAFSLNENADSDFAKAVDEVYNSSDNRFDNSRWVELGTTPEALIQAGIDDKAMFVNFAKIGKIKSDHPEMTAELLKQLPKELNNPVAVFKNTKGKPNSYVVLTELTVKGNERVIAALHAEQELNGLVFHKLASAYGKDGTQAYLENMIEKAEVRFVDKQKAGRINSKLQLLAEDTLNLLFNKASVVKNDDSVNSQDKNATDDDGDNVRYSRKQSALEQARNGKADARETLRDEILSFDRETYKDLYNRFTSKVHEAFADSRKPVIDFINRFEGVADNVKQRIVQSMQSAENVRDVQRGVIEENYAKPIIDSLVKLGNKSKLDLLTAKRLAGFWISARWSIQKNQMLLDRAEKAMVEAKDLYDSALQHSQDQAVIDRAELDYIKARNHYNGLKHDVELDLGNDYSNKSFKVGVAGGWSIPEAKLLMKTIEGKLAVNDLQALAEQVYDLNQALLKLDEKSGRYTDEELAEYRSHRQYVPLTGDPSTRTDDIDFIGGVAQKAFNIGRDKALKGRENSEAEDAFDAMWKNIGKTTQYYGWADFKQELASVFDERVSDLEQAGYSKRDAKNEAAKQLGFNKQGMSGLTRTNDDVLTYKDNGKYYEIQLPATVADALRGDNRESSISPLVRAVDAMFAKPTKLMARGITQLSFDFPIVNMIRDVMGKAIYIAHEDIYDQTGKPLSAAEKYAIGFKVYQKALSHTFNIGNNLFAATFKHAWGAKLKDSGIQGDLKELIEYGGFSNFTNNLARSEADFVKQLKQSSSILSRTSAIAKHLLNTWGGTFDAVSSLVTYKALKDSGIDPKQAAGLVLETANFRKQGASLTNARNAFMFLQPKMMDAQKMARIMHTKRGALELLGRSVVMAMLYAAIGSLWSYVLGDDAEDEGGSLLAQLGDITGYVPIPLPESVREALKSVSGLANIKGNFFKLHLGFGMNQIAWNNGFNLVRAIQGEIKPEEAVVNIGVNWIKNFAPVTPSEVSADKDPINKMVQTFTPTALLPIIQSATNHSAFGSAITPTNVNNEELKATQAKPNTAPEWEAMSTWIFDNMGVDLHPETVKHFVNSYGIIFGSARELINVHIENPNRERLGKTQRVPFLTRFIGMPNENSIPNKYYEAVGESKQATARYNRYKEIGDDEKMKETEPLMRFNQLIEQKTKDVDKEKLNLRNALNKGRMSQEVYDRKMLLVRKREEVIQRALVRQYRQDNGLYTKP